MDLSLRGSFLLLFTAGLTPAWVRKQSDVLWLVRDRGGMGPTYRVCRTARQNATATLICSGSEGETVKQSHQRVVAGEREQASAAPSHDCCTPATHTRTHTHRHTHAHTHTQAHTRAHTHTGTHTRTHTHRHTHARTHAHAQKYACMHTHPHTHKRTHTYTNTMHTHRNLGVITTTRHLFLSWLRWQYDRMIVMMIVFWILTKLQPRGLWTAEKHYATLSIRF